MQLPIGYDDFSEIREKRLEFIDKSLFIEAILKDSATKVALITRPRRFGKTLNLSMLYYYLSNQVEKERHLFEGLKILQSGDTYLWHQNRYPVIFITLKDIKASSYDSAYKHLSSLLSELYETHAYLLNSEKITDQRKQVFERILTGQGTGSELTFSIKHLSQDLHQHYGIKPWLLIDEYDTPIHSAYASGYYPEMMEFMRGFFGSALKSNVALEKAVITGILRVAKESLFSGLNNLKVYSLLQSQYSEYFGFTQTEVDEILKRSDLSSQAQAIKDWYNGYTMGGKTVIYNPWSIVNCVAERTLKPYWINTSDNQLIKDLIKPTPIKFKQEFQHLMEGKSLEKLLDEHLAFQYLNHTTASLWNLLLMAGYLKPISIRETDQGTFGHLAVPNREVKNLYRQIIEQWLSNGEGIEWYNEFLASLLTGEMETFKSHLEKILLQITSYHDFAQEPEAFYHGILLGLTVSLYDSQTYEILSNRESGRGRLDMALIPKDTSQLGIVLEFKAMKNKQRILEAARQALKQINAQDYDTLFKQRGISNVLKIGIGFSGKLFRICFEKTGFSEHLD